MILQQIIQEITTLNDTITQTQASLDSANVTIAQLNTDKNNLQQSMQSTIDGLTVDKSNLQSTLQSTTGTLNATINNLNTTIAQLKANPPITLQQVKAQRIIGSALTFDYENVPYKFNTDWDTDKTFDCSGFTLICFKVGAGITLPRNSRQQSEVGVDVAFEDMKPGDLLFYDFDHDGTITHVSMYIGDGKIIQTNTPQSGINVQNSTWNKAAIVKIKRVNELV